MVDDTLTKGANFIQLYPDTECWGCGGVCGHGLVAPCSNCGYGFYCDVRCQRVDRRRHAPLCALIVAAVAAEESL
jgi:hypothetical protein